MNPKTRALIWEECCMGGSIAAACTLLGIALQVVPQLELLLTGSADNTWNHAKDFMLIATLGVPVFTSLLLILNVASSGNLSFGFPQRLLRLPVDTWRVVLIVLGMRLLDAFAIGAALIGTCRLVCHHGPGLRTAFLLAGAYLVFQVLTWALEVVPILAGLAIITLVAAPLVLSGGVAAFGGFAVATSPPTLLFLLVFAGCVVVAYAVSVVLVRLIRRGDRFFTVSLPAFDATRFRPDARAGKPFASARAAQLWYERRRAGLFLPVMAVLMWIVCVAIRWILLYSLHSNSAPVDFKELLDTTWLFEYFPYIALALAGFAWAPAKAEGAGLSGARPAGFMQRLPITKAEAARARLLAAAMNLMPVLIVIAIVFAVHFVRVDHGQFLRLLSDALLRGETNSRELGAFFVGVPLLAGLVVWSIMNMPVRVMAALAALGVSTVILLYAAVCINLLVEPMRDPDVALLLGIATVIVFLAAGVSMRLAIRGRRAIAIAAALLLGFLYFTVLVDFRPPWFYYMTWLFLSVAFLVITPPLLLAGCAAAAWWKGLISTRSLGACALAWAAVTLLLFPFSMPSQGDETLMLFVLSLSIAALPVLPFVLIVLDLSHRGLAVPISREDPAQHRRTRQTWPLSMRAAATILFVGIAAFLTWLRWPSEPAYRTALRARGLPATLAELDASYKRVEPERNLAPMYMRIAKEHATRNDAFRMQHRGADSNSQYLLGEGEGIKRTQLIPSDAWQYTKEYCDRVGNVTFAELDAAAHSGLHESRYPVDLNELPWAYLRHLSNLRDLVCALSVRSQVACVERDSKVAVDAILDMLPIFDSLKDEPILVSQLVRIGLLRPVYSSAEALLNRVSLPEAELARLERGIAESIPPAEKQLLLDRGLLGEQIWMTDYYERYTVLQFVLDYYDLSILNEATMTGLWALFQYGAFAVLTDVSGEKRIDPLCMSVCFDAIRERAKKSAAQHWDLGSGFEQAWFKHMFAWAPFTCISMPVKEDSYAIEWRVRTEMEVAQAGVAVERYRSAHGRLPSRLDELVPEFLDSVPRDFYNDGKPLSYRIKENGEFVVYSWGHDLKDGHGEEFDENGKYRCDDITFAVAPPEMRDRPQVLQGKS